MAIITKTAGGFYQAAEQLAAAVVSITVVAPPPGFAVQVERIVGYMRGGTSQTIRCNFQSAPVAGSPDGVALNRNLTEETRTVGQAHKVDITGPFCGGNGQQVDILLNGEVADSTQCGLWAIYRYIKV
jgi:hypothetical protein